MVDLSKEKDSKDRVDLNGLDLVEAVTIFGDAALSLPEALTALKQ